MTAAAGGAVAAAHLEQGTMLVDVMVIVEIEGVWRTVVLPAAVTVWPIEQEEYEVTTTSVTVLAIGIGADWMGETGVVAGIEEE